MEPKFYGPYLADGERALRETGGAIYSRPPEDTDTNAWGFWGDEPDGALVRSWERSFRSLTALRKFARERGLD